MTSSEGFDSRYGIGHWGDGAAPLYGGLMFWYLSPPQVGRLLELYGLHTGTTRIPMQHRLT